MHKLKVTIVNKQTKVKIPSGIRMIIRRCCSAVLTEEKMDGVYEVSVSFVDDEQIRELNRQFRDKDVSTDVLSFPLSDDGVFDVNHDTGAMQLGDIVISVEHAIMQAESYGHTLQREMGYLTAHSMFHLLGYDHESGGIEAVRMREKEEAVMNSMGLSRDESFVDSAF